MSPCGACFADFLSSSELLPLPAASTSFFGLPRFAEGVVARMGGGDCFALLVDAFEDDRGAGDLRAGDAAARFGVARLAGGIEGLCRAPSTGVREKQRRFAVGACTCPRDLSTHAGG